MPLPASLTLAVKTPLAALAAVLMLSACVDPMATSGTAAPEQPAIVIDETIYAARSDGSYTVPALPVEQIPEAYRRQEVAYATNEAPGTIIIDPSQRMLYYVLTKDKALRYGIAVGAEGFGWSGEAIVSNKKHWPTWTPPKEMIARKPELAKWENGQPGGPTNPLGARAIYLTSNGVDYGYRIHGTPEWKSIGRNASSGCFRMINQDVMDLFERVKGGEKVIVLTSKGEMPKGLSIPKPPAPKKKAEPKPAAVPAPELSLMGPPPALGGAPVTPAAPVAPAPAVAPATPAPAPAEPAAAPAPVAPAPVVPAPVSPAPLAPAPTPACTVPLVNGVCPAN
ncbi:L,D-transpeptidase [Neotabrizicola sp. VNH66]|uniref:L,D-transpeptidase n=1 Tax=Neotabrizicola sp. VNH66 TaxID=3400918 RepID=UPI003C0615DC